MLEDQWFAILRAFHYSKLLFDKIRTDHIYKGDEPYGPYDQNPNRGEETKNQKSAKQPRGDEMVTITQKV